MKRIIVSAILLSSTSMVLAESGPGCGVGAEIFKGQSGLAPNVLAATTNNIIPNTFSMTTGILGCDQNHTITAQADLFIDKNMERVAKDMSAGYGESLETLATLIGITSSEDQTKFFKISQKNFTAIYTRDDVTSSEVLDSLKEIMLSDADLAKYLG